MSRFNKGGFEDRFTVTRKDGKPIRADARYLVLDYSGADPHAKLAIEVYAASVRSDNIRLATDLRDALSTPSEWPTQH